MKLKVRYRLIALVLVIFSAFARGQNATVTLLPMKENPVEQGPSDAKGLLWLQKKEPKTINLSFNLAILPAGLSAEDFKDCTLRLVARQVIFQPNGEGDPNTGGSPISVRGWLASAGYVVPDNADSTVALSILSEQKQPVTMNRQTSPEFRDAVYQAYSRDKKIYLVLRTNSDRASSLFYSSKEFKGDPSNMPRLVITYKSPSPSMLESLSWPQRQHDPEHSGRTPWSRLPAPVGFNLGTITPPALDGVAGNPVIADYPLIYRGNLYVIYHYDSGNYLVCLDFTGKRKIWQQKILGNTVQRSPVISRLGFLYVVTEGLISSYDLNRNGAMALNYNFGKLSNYTDITVGNDGSLYLALEENEGNYIYGYEPLLNAFLRAGPFEKEAISTVTVSAAGNKIFAQTTAGGVTIDLSDPDPRKRQTIKLSNAGDFYWTPLAGPAGGVMVFSDMSTAAKKGNAGGYDTKEIWRAAGAEVRQPVLGTKEGRLGAKDYVYFIQGDKLYQHTYDQMGSARELASGVNATSNLVMDGANNIYFWNNGTFYAYGPSGAQPFAPQTMTGPPENIRLAVAPDGTLWANNKSSLFAFLPKYESEDQKFSASNLVSRTAYRATGKLTIDAGAVKEGSQVLLEGGTGISFSGGFRVPQGATILCRTGR